MPGSPLRNELVEYLHSEVDRVGVDGVDRTAMVKVFMAKGGARSRIFAWIKEELELLRNPPPPGPDLMEAEIAQAEALIRAADRAAVLNAIPSPTEIRKLEQQAAVVVRAVRHESRSASAPDTVPMIDGSGVPVVASPAGNGIGIVMAKLERAMETVDQCITYSYGENGKLRNARMALAAADGLRRCLETALRLHEAVDNVQAVQRFMDEIMVALREVSPEVAAAVVERMRGVTARWAK